MFSIRIAIVGAVAMACAQALAQIWPAKPIRMITPYPPGGATDILSRLIAPRLELGQPVIVEARAGAGGNLGTDHVAKSAPDGYTLLMGASGPMAINASLYPKLPYDPAKDLQAIVLVASVPLVLVAHPSVPAGNVRELIALLRKEPDKYNYVSAGSGTPQHLSAELFKSMTGTRMQQIAYKGTGPAFTDLASGRVPLAFMSVIAVQPYVQGGKLKALAVTGPVPSASMPGVPTVAQSGVPGYESNNWFGVAGPAGMPPEIVSRLNAELNRVLGQTEMKARLFTMGSEPVAGTPTQFAAFIRAEIVKWAKIVKESGATAED